MPIGLEWPVVIVTEKVGGYGKAYFFFGQVFSPIKVYNGQKLTRLVNTNTAPSTDGTGGENGSLLSRQSSLLRRRQAEDEEEGGGLWC